MFKIDAHSHFYKSYGGPDNAPQEYFTNVENIDIAVSVVSPGPCPEYFTADSLYRPCRWKYIDGRFQYFQQFCNPESRELYDERSANQNPFHEINIKLLNDLENEYKLRKTEVFVTPLYHPLLDSEDEIKTLISHNRVVGLKLHGVATATGPETVPQAIADVLRKTQKVLVVHTDNYIKTPAKPLHHTYLMNNPTKWVRWAIENDVKVLITHGARLSRDAISLAMEHKNIVIGIAPGILIMNSDLDRLETPTKNFEKDLLSIVPIDQLVFDIDYGWNVINRNDWQSNDWDMCQRIDLIASELGIDAQKLESFYSGNAERFFNL